MAYCENCGNRLRDSGRCGWCEEESVIYYEQYEYVGKNEFPDSFVKKAIEQERNHKN